MDRQAAKQGLEHCSIQHSVHNEIDDDAVRAKQRNEPHYTELVLEKV